jgi:hypothetical protein
MKVEKREFEMKRTEQAQPIQSHKDPMEQVRRRAYELYEERGRVDGFEVHDWLQAEAEVVHGQRTRKAA